MPFGPRSRSPPALFHICWRATLPCVHTRPSAVKRRLERPFREGSLMETSLCLPAPGFQHRASDLDTRASWQLPRAQGSRSSFIKLTHLFVYAGVTLVMVLPCCFPTPHPITSLHLPSCLAESGVLSSPGSVQGVALRPLLTRLGLVGPLDVAALGGGLQLHKGLERTAVGFPAPS